MTFMFHELHELNVELRYLGRLIVLLVCALAGWMIYHTFKSEKRGK